MSCCNLNQYSNSSKPYILYTDNIAVTILIIEVCFLSKMDYFYPIFRQISLVVISLS